MELDRNALLALKPGAPRKVTIPDAGEIYLRMMNGAERDSWEAERVIWEGEEARISGENLRARLLCRTICDKDGNRLFKDEDAEAVGQMRADVLALLYEVSKPMNYISAADIEALAKN